MRCGRLVGRYWMDEEETRQLEKHNAHYAASRGVWDLLNEHFTPCDLPESTEEKLDALWAATEVYDCTKYLLQP